MRRLGNLIIYNNETLIVTIRLLGAKYLADTSCTGSVPR